MAVFKIVEFPDPALQKKCKPVEVVSLREKAFLDDMLETMYLNQGVGLAAPQVGILKRAIVVDAGEGPLGLINPILIKKSGSEREEEGCLSLPDVRVKVKRAKSILYKGLDKDGRLVEGEAEGLLARAIQHEIDHLDGKLIIDYANPVKRFFLKKRLLKNTRT